MDDDSCRWCGATADCFADCGDDVVKEMAALIYERSPMSHLAADDLAQDLMGIVREHDDNAATPTT